MKFGYVKALSLLAIAVVVFAAVPSVFAQEYTQDYSASFLLLNHPDGDLTYRLNVTIPQELVNYYSMQSHFLFDPGDFPKFVTPYTLKPIADQLSQIYNNTEDFTNGVLMLAHQITYQEVEPPQYPVETLAQGYGDCDLFAYIAASILKAGGISTVLLYFKAQEHMEIGVALGATPNQTRTEIHDVEYQNVPYYVGECTGSSWRDSWRVGEAPSEFQNVSVQVIPLQDEEQSYVGQVSASLKALDPSTINMQTSTSLMLEGNKIIINGQIVPQSLNENVTLQAKINGPGWTTIGTVPTRADGRFQYTWTPPAGSVTIRANWLGNGQNNGAKSAEAGVTILPLAVVLLVLIAAAGIAIVALLFAVLVRTKKKSLASQEGTQPENSPPLPPPAS